MFWGNILPPSSTLKMETVCSSETLIVTRLHDIINQMTTSVFQRLLGVWARAVAQWYSLWGIISQWFSWYPLSIWDVCNHSGIFGLTYHRQQRYRDSWSNKVSLQYLSGTPERRIIVEAIPTWCPLTLPGRSSRRYQSKQIHQSMLCCNSSPPKLTGAENHCHLFEEHLWWCIVSSLTIRVVGWI